MGRKGLTLMELLTVISILATLAALLFPVFISVRSRSDLIACADQLHQIGIALKMYAHDWGDETPYAIPYPRLLGGLYPHYIRNDAILICPTFRKAAPKEFLEGAKRLSPPAWSSYFVFIGRGIDESAQTNPSTWISFAEIYAKRGDQIPIAMCTTHWEGCPTSNMTPSMILMNDPSLPFFNCRALANPNAPYVILRWSGQVNFVHAKSKSTLVILLTH